MPKRGLAGPILGGGSEKIGPTKKLCRSSTDFLCRADFFQSRRQKSDRQVEIEIFVEIFDLPLITFFSKNFVYKYTYIGVVNWAFHPFKFIVVVIFM